jgi:glycosyltransferase involved in cell wall biosynthesis
MSAGGRTVSVVIPCLDERESIAACVTSARDAIEAAGFEGEVIVVDNGSSDGSDSLAEQAGARLVREPRRGYGSAYLAGFATAQGDYIVMADGDGSYDLADVPRFVARLDAGAEFVIGSRLKGTIHPGAMPRLHRWVGNPLLTGILNVFFRTGVSDAHCGMRAFRRDALERLDLRTTGMELASEQVIRASKIGLRIEELPIDYRPRVGESKLASFSDGWRHLRFLLVHSPTWLFMVPGALLLAVGLLVGLLVAFEVELFGHPWQLHALIAAAVLSIVGAQVISMGLFARAYAAYYLGEDDPLFARLRSRFRLEHGLIGGGLLTTAGAVMLAVVLVTWIDRGFGELREEKLAVGGLTLLVLGIQAVFAAFLLSILGLRRRVLAGEEPELDLAE